MAFGFLLYFVSGATNRKSEAYLRLQDSLKDLTSYVKVVAPNTKLGSSDELMVRLVQCEELVSTIGIMSIKRIVAGVEAASFIKSFVILAAVLISGVAGPIIIRTSKTAGMGIHIFFCVLTSLIFVEIAWKVIEKRRSYSTSLRARKKMNRHNVIKSAAGVPHRFASSICDFGSSVVSSPGGQRRHDRHSRCAKRFPY
jgi:hypothetical protein